MSDKLIPRAAIVDYQMGNLFSVQQACHSAGIEPIVTDDKDIIRQADGLILPGVGAFGDAMEHLEKLDLIGCIKDFVAQGKPFFGICLGLQLIMTESEEFGLHKGLNIIPGRTVKLNPEHKPDQISKVPEVGWNQITPPDGADGNYWNNTPLQDIQAGEYMYFVHSFIVQPEDSGVILTQTNYENVTFCSGIQKNNVFAVQFHPEKSAHSGLRIYRQWCSMIRQQREKAACL